MITNAVREHSVSAPCLERKWHEAKWFALYTRSRHEKLVDRELQKKGIETFLPTRTITRQWSDRKKIIQEPLFKGYLFVHAPLAERWTVLNTTGAVSLVGKPGDPIEVPERELWAVRRFIEERAKKPPKPKKPARLRDAFSFRPSDSFGG